METKSTTLNFEYGIASEMESNQMLTEHDRKCFAEISKVLKKYQAQNRFGITLMDVEESKTAILCVWKPIQKKIEHYFRK